MSIKAVFLNLWSSLQHEKMLYAQVSLYVFLFVWTQDLVPLLSPLFSTLALTFALSKLFTSRLQNAKNLLYLGFLALPLNILWTVLNETFLQIKNLPPLNLFLIWSLLVFIFLAYHVYLGSIFSITTKSLNIDAALKVEGARLLLHLRSVTFFSVFLATIWTLGFWGLYPWSIFLLLPLSLAYYKVTCS